VFCTRLDPKLVARVKMYAIGRNQPISAVVTTALERLLPDQMEVSEVAASGKRRSLRRA
jgi:hypothetical protein